MTVLITGATRGIGKALAEKFVMEGHGVIGTGRPGQAKPIMEKATWLELDLSSGESIAQCAAEAASLGMPIDILVNNAGVLEDEDETAVVPELLRKTLEVNVVGTADFTERIIPLMSPSGHIVNISSTAGSLELTDDKVSHYPGHYPAYKISKAALNMYGRTLAGTLAEKGITVSSVHPGWVRTDMGGPEADMSPEEAAADIYAFAISKPATGGFWFKGNRLPW